MKRKYANPMREKLREKSEYRRSQTGRYMAFIGSGTADTYMRFPLKKQCTTGHEGDEG